MLYVNQRNSLNYTEYSGKGKYQYYIYSSERRKRESEMKTKVKRFLAITLAVMTAAAFSLGLDTHPVEAKTKKCSTPVITKAVATKCNEVSVWYSGAGKNATTYFVYMKAPGGSYKLLTKKAYSAKYDKSTYSTAHKLKPNATYSFKVRAANAYYEKQYYNSKKHKWQKKKPKKKNWKGKKTRNVLKYRWYSSYSKVKNVKTKGHSYKYTTTAATFEKGGTVKGKCIWCSAATTKAGAAAGNIADVKATASLVNRGTAIRLTWNAAKGATGYEIERSVNGGSYSQVYFSSKLVYIDKDISESNTYRYRVTAYKNGNTSSAFSKKASETAGILVKKAIVVTDAESEPKKDPNYDRDAMTYALSWDEFVIDDNIKAQIPDIDWENEDVLTNVGYILQIDGKEIIGEAEDSYSSYDITEYVADGMQPGTHHTVKVIPYIHTITYGGCGYDFMVVPFEEHAQTITLDIPKDPEPVLPSTDALLKETNASAAPPVITTNAPLITAGYNKLTLTWTGSPGAKDYVISVGGTETATSKCTYEITGLTPKTKYTISVKARRGTVTGSTKQISATTLETPVPGGITTSASKNSMKISWNAVSGAQKYSVLDAASGSTLYSGTGTSFTVSGLVPSTEYGYYVVAYVNGVPSDQMRGYIKTKTLSDIDPPKNITASPGPSFAILEWNAVSGASGYRIYNSGKSLVTNVNATSYTVSELKASTSYTYYIVAGKNGKWGDITDACKVTFKTTANNKKFVIDPNVKLDYQGVSFYMGQTWTTSLRDKLKAVSSGYEAVNRPKYAMSPVDWEPYDATVYFFDINDYSDFLMVYVSDGIIIEWLTNGSSFGNAYGKTYKVGDCMKGLKITDKIFGSQNGYKVGSSDTIFVDYEDGDTVTGGFCNDYYGLSDYNKYYNIESEKRVGFHLINAYRKKAGGRSILQYNNYLDGKNYTWSGTTSLGTYKNTRYGAQACAETEAASNQINHNTEDMKYGPLKGQTSEERSLIMWYASDKTYKVDWGENTASGCFGEGCLEGYLKSWGHRYNILHPRTTIIGIGFAGGCHTEIFGE